MKSIHDIYKTVEHRVDKMRLTVHLHAHEYILLNRFLESLNRKKDGYRETYMDMGYEYGSIHGIIIQWHLEKEESFLSAAPMIEFLLKAGWAEDSQSENADWGYREVAFAKLHTEPPMGWKEWDTPWKPEKIKCTLRMWVHPLSMICEKVQDGTKPKYKFVCQGANI